MYIYYIIEVINNSKITNKNKLKYNLKDFKVLAILSIIKKNHKVTIVPAT